MSKQACKCKEVECEECPEWIFTLADLIMCMMGLFVILWVLKPGTKEQPLTEQEIKVIAGIREGFGYEGNPDSSDPIDQYLIDKMKSHSGDGNKGESQQESQGAIGKADEVTTIRPGPDATLGGRGMFDPGQYDLRDEVKAQLDQVIVKIKGHRTVVVIKGHAGLDDLPDKASSQEYMDLSVKRAQAVQDYLVSQGVSADTLRVQGCSTYEPINQKAYSKEARAANRRVEIDETQTLVRELQDASTTAIPAGAVDHVSAYVPMD